MRYFVKELDYDRHVVLPLSINGVAVSPEEAVDAFLADEINDAGTYKDSGDAHRRCEKLNHRGK